jgi:hypothetical protein
MPLLKKFGITEQLLQALKNGTTPVMTGTALLQQTTLLREEDLFIQWLQPMVK